MQMSLQAHVVMLSWVQGYLSHVHSSAPLEGGRALSTPNPSRARDAAAGGMSWPALSKGMGPDLVPPMLGGQVQYQLKSIDVAIAFLAA